MGYAERKFRKRPCGHCTATIEGSAADLMQHSVERHGTASFPRGRRVGKRKSKGFFLPQLLAMLGTGPYVPHNMKSL